MPMSRGTLYGDDNIAGGGLADGLTRSASEINAPGGMSPALFWLMLVLLLVGARVIWELAEED